MAPNVMIGLWHIVNYVRLITEFKNCSSLLSYRIEVFDICTGKPRLIRGKSTQRKVNTEKGAQLDGSLYNVARLLGRPMRNITNCGEVHILVQDRKLHRAIPTTEIKGFRHACQLGKRMELVGGPPGLGIWKR